MFKLFSVTFTRMAWQGNTLPIAWLTQILRIALSENVLRNIRIRVKVTENRVNVLITLTLCRADYQFRKIVEYSLPIRKRTIHAKIVFNVLDWSDRKSVPL